MGLSNFCHWSISRIGVSNGAAVATNKTAVALHAPTGERLLANLVYLPALTSVDHDP